MSPSKNWLTRNLLLLGATFVAATAFGQYSIIPGTYTDNTFDMFKFTLVVTKSSGKNWTVKGIFNRSGTNYRLSGTLYASGKLALQPNLVNPKDKRKVYYRYEDGAFDPQTGTIDFRLYMGGAARENKGLLILTAVCKNPKNKPKMETVWVLKEGFPKYDVVYEKGSKPFTVDAGGTMVWPATSLKDGKPISQTLKFSPPKKEYKPGEEFEVFVDASGTEKGAYPYVLIQMYFGWAPGGWIGIGNDKSQYNESVKFRPTGKTKFEPSSESEAAILVGAAGYGGLRWEYRKIERPAKPATTGK